MAPTLKLVKTLWGVDDAADPEKWDALFARIKAEGFSAVEAITLAWRADKAKFCSLLEKHGLSLVCQIHTSGGDVDPKTGEYLYCTSNKLHDHLASFTRLVAECAGLPLKPIFINSHSGHDSWGSGEKAVAFFKKALTVEKALGVPVVHETHRQRLLYSPYTATELLAVPELAALKINADLSHWCCVCEHVFDAASPRDDWWPATLAAVAKHCEFIHCRIGHAEGPQVPEPDAPEYSTEASAHYSWWRTIWAAQAERAAAGDGAVVWAEPEFGPPPYLQTQPYTKAPVGDLWDINKRVAARVRTEFDQALAAPEPKAGAAQKGESGAVPMHWRTDAEARASGSIKHADGRVEARGGHGVGHEQGQGGGLLDLALKKEAAAEKEAAKEAAKAAKEAEKLKKAVVKEGGKKGVEIEGASDMGGLDFFCTTIESPEGSIDLLCLAMAAMNAKPAEGEEERKGCSGHVGKMIFSAGKEQLALVGYVPDGKAAKIDVTEWMQSVLESVGGVVMMAPAEKAESPDGGMIVQAVIKADPDNGRFPLKDKDLAMAAAFMFLRERGAFPEDDGADDDEVCFGDDAFDNIDEL